MSTEVVKSQQVVSSGDVTKNIRPTMALAQEHIDVLKKPESTEEADQQHMVNAGQEQLQQQKDLQEVRTFSMKEDRVPRRSRQDRAFDRIAAHLDSYKQSKIGSVDKVVALQQVVALVTQYPKKNNLDYVFTFFKEHKNEEFLSEANALQNIANLSPDLRIKVELLYHLMFSLAKGDATKRNISIDTIRDVFQSDDLANWVAITMRNSYRR